MCAGGPFQRCFHLRTSSDLAGKLVLNIFLVLHGLPGVLNSKVAHVQDQLSVALSHLKIFFEGIAMKHPAKASKATTVVVLGEDAHLASVVSEASLIRHPEGEWHQGALPKAQVIFNFDVMVLLRNRWNQTNWLLEWLLAALEVRKCAGRDEVFPLAEGRGTEGRGSMQLQN